MRTANQNSKLQSVQTCLTTFSTRQITYRQDVLTRTSQNCHSQSLRTKGQRFLLSLLRSQIEILSNFFNKVDGHLATNFNDNQRGLVAMKVRQNPP